MTITLLFDVPLLEMPRPQDSWLPETIKLIYRWANNSEHFKLVNIKDYHPESCPNSYYLKMIGTTKDSLDPTSWNTIPEESVRLINANNINIIIMLPFERVTCLTESTLQEYALSFRTKFKYSKLVNVSMTTLLDQNGEQILTEQLFNDPNLKDILFVPTVGFLDKHFAVFSDIRMLSHQITTNDYDSIRPNLFLCLNNNPNLARKFIVQSLFITDLWKYGQISFRQTAAWTIENILKIDPFQLTNEQFIFYINLISSIKQQNLCPITIQDQNAIDSRLDVTLNTQWYKDSWCSIITETYDDPATNVDYESPLITEKTIKPIMMLHPFMVFGNGNSHKWLQSLGFKTFEQSWFGLPEDGAVGNRTLLERTYNVIQSLKQLATLTQDELYAKWKGIEVDLIYNKEHMLTTDWTGVQAKLINSTCK